MPEALEIALTPERLDEGSPEERACFGVFSVRSGLTELTAGLDYFTSGYRLGPLVSGYHAAEWFAWNWWRLRFEPRSTAQDWWRAHKMTAIGEGYSWPNLTIYSDGFRTVLLAKPSSQPDAKPFRYLGANPVVVPSVEFEAALDAFIPRIIGRLREQGLLETNLNRIWRDVLAERADAEMSRRRRLEALLARGADEIEDGAVEGLVADAASLGEGAVEELAAERAQGGALMTAEGLEQTATNSGVDAAPRDAVKLGREAHLPSPRDAPPWRLGSLAARALRAQQRMGGEPISSERLARMAGVQTVALSKEAASASLSFALDRNAAQGRVVLRSRWETGRRFDLARLLADRLVIPTEGRLHAATRAYTYRQKMQRSFAAELLSPFEAVDAMLAGDYSSEAQAEAAEYFRVSPLTILTLLVNHKRLEREELDEDIGVAA
jgi:hypothetical protein